MNMLLIEYGDIVAPGHARIGGRRFEHMRDVLKAKVGAEIRVGIVDDLCGTATVRSITSDECDLEYCCTALPPRKLPLTLVVALPRPQTFKKVLEQATSLGVSSFVFVHTAKVEKSFWSSPVLLPGEVRKHLLLGLEQSLDTVLPSVVFEPDFGAFMRERVGALIAGKEGLIAHPHNAISLAPRAFDVPVVAVVGPEGGLLAEEVALFRNKKFTPVSIGSRILRVETAVVALAARLYL